MTFEETSSEAFAERDRLNKRIAAQNSKRKEDYASYFNRRLGLPAVCEVCNQIREINARAKKGRAA